MVAFYRSDGRWLTTLAGPAGEQPRTLEKVAPQLAERLCAAALAEANRHAALRTLSAALDDSDTELPGLRNAGMFSTHQLKVGVPMRPDWDAACERGRELLSQRGRQLVEALGFEVEPHSSAASVLRATGTRRALALFLSEDESFESGTERLSGASPVSHALAVARREGLPWVVLTRWKPRPDPRHTRHRRGAAGPTGDVRRAQPDAPRRTGRLFAALAESRRDGHLRFDAQATDRWEDVRALWDAVREGNDDWEVPAYNGGLFSTDPDVSSAGAVLADVRLTNAEFGPVLDALLVDEDDDGVIGPVDFRSLLYGLDETDVRVVFETFHEGWDYRFRLARTLETMRELAG